MTFRSASSLLAPVSLAILAAACANATGRSGFENGEEKKEEGTAQPAPGDTGNLGQQAPPSTEDPPEVSEVFGHSASTLYKLDPVTKGVSVVGDFDGCGPVIDIALDEKSTLIAASYQALYTVDKTTASCTEIAKGDYPNSLSFVPKGTVDPNEEALVGYDNGDYLRIDVKSGSVSKIGAIGGSYVSSGDIVSVKGGKTYLTVKGGSCDTNDCLIEVDPKTGKMIKNWGSIEHQKVFGLSFWGGKVYGFDESGSLFEVAFGTKQLATTEIPIPQAPSGLAFWGAGSSTSAPLVQPTK
jgi:hypothetical protein